MIDMKSNSKNNMATSGIQSQPHKLGTFTGVFTPSILTILGIILFMRLGYVVGNAGFLRVLMILGIANTISIMTSISLSAIATNLKVKGGGDYYLISRTLGVEFGGAIGIVLFLAQSVSIAFYCVGFAEAVSFLLSESTFFTPSMIAVLAVSFLFCLAWMGADWASKFQYVVMTLLAAALISFFWGGIPKWESAIFFHNLVPPVKNAHFWMLFAVFFPAVTGFTQGVSMSGDLKDPGKSLPLGTFSAVFVSIFVYFAVAVVFAGVFPNEILMNDFSTMKQAAKFGFLIDAGVIAATLSSAMASFLGAPRILQSLAADRIFTLLLPFAKVSGGNQNPRRGVLLSAVIAFSIIGLGNLNLIAQVVSMFFLISYGLLNYATYYEAGTASPSFRPRFRFFHKNISLAGFIACLLTMMAIDLKSGMVAITFLFAVYQYLKRTAVRSRWSDSSRSYHLQKARDHVIAASLEAEHPRDWRPQVLAFTHHPDRRKQLLDFSNWIQGKSGLTTAVQIIQGSGIRAGKLKEETIENLKTDIIKKDLKAFPLVISASDMGTALQILLQSYGIGPLRANTILINWVDQLGKGIPTIDTLQYVKNIRMMFQMGCNVVILSTSETEWKNVSDRGQDDYHIDVWWQPTSTGRLMLMFAYLMTRHPAWDDAKIRLIAVDDVGGQGDNDNHLKNMLDDFRIEASPVTVADMEPETVAAVSKDAAVVFMPFRLVDFKFVDASGYSLTRVLRKISHVALVKAAEDIDLTAEPEEGAAGEIAAALDELADAEKKAGNAEKEAEEAKRKIEKLKDIISSYHSSRNSDESHKIMDDLDKARIESVKASRKAAKAKVKLEDADKKLQGLAPIAEEKDEQGKS